MGEVINLTAPTRIDGDPARILEAAVAADLMHVVIVGYDKSGAEYFASSYADGADALWALQRGALKLLRVADV